MTKFFLHRLVATVPVFIGATFVIWAMVFALPGDPIRALSGFRAQPPEVNTALREQYNLNDPLVVQFVKYLWNVIRFDFGSDFRGNKVSDLLREALPHSLRVVSIALVFIVVVGVILGTVAALCRGRLVDSIIAVVTALTLAVPAVIVAPLVRYYSVVDFRWFRNGDASGWGASVLPGIVLGLVSVASIARLLRSAHVEAMQDEYIRTAAAKGLSARRIIGIHSMRNALQPIASFIGADITVLLGATALVETVFDIPGVGRLLVLAARDQETPVVAATVMFLVVIAIVANFMADVLAAALDPRRRL